MQRRGRLDYTTLIKIANKYDCRVHGFAMTKLKALKTFPFYSVDSSSWNAIMVYGTSTIRKAQKAEGIFEGYYARTPKGRTYLIQKEIEAWNKREDFLTKLWESRGVKWT